MVFHWQLFFGCFIFGSTVLYVQAVVAAADEEESCPVYEFACKNGSECIPSEWRCDRDFDCKDSSDEQDCEGEFCDPESEFQCAASRCIPHGWVCDGIDDCGDNSDEQGDECETPAESCSMDEYQCPGTNDCISLHLLCDQSIDCGDRSDEGSHCLSQIQKCAEKNCEEMCKYSITGARCYCAEGRQLDSNNRTCSDYDECRMVRVPVCDQTCVNQENATNTCKCLPTFTLQEDKRTCKSSTSTTALLFVASGEKVMSMSLVGESRGELDAVRTNAINYDYKRKKVCWIDRRRSGRQLNCVDSETLKSSNQVQITFDIKGVEQFAIEWTTGNFYFVDSRADRIFICTSGNENNQCLTIVSEGLANPRGIAIDPVARYFFVSDWSSNPKIIRYSIDGTDANVIVKTKISLPQCLSLDMFTKRVYWTDATMDHIQSIPYDGNQALRYTVISGPDMMDHPYGVAVFENYVYSTNWREQFEIKKTNRFEAFTNDSLIIHKGGMQSAAIQLYHSSLQPTVIHPCATNNGGCDHICLIVNGQKKDYCRCSVGFNLNDNGTCTRHVLKDGFLIYGKGMPGAIKGISMDSDDNYDVIEPLLNMESPRGIDFDIQDEFIYYADSATFRIVRRPLVGNQSDAQQLLDQYVNNCEGIAVDWMSRNLYWTDDGLKRISIAKLNGTFRRTLITTNLTHPRAIVVDPADGYMYWTDWSEYDSQLAKIERSNLDGTQREVLISGETILWPNGLALDKTGNYLYWCDAFFDQISRVHLNGTGREIIYNGVKLEMPFGLSFFNDVLFWTERKSGKIYRYKIGGNEPVLLRNEGQEVFEIRTYSSQLQSGDNNCSSNNGGCQQLCVNTASGIVCLCEDGHRLNLDNKTCDLDPENPQGTHCDTNEEITCNNGRCVRKAWKCDGDDDCGDGTDETPENCNDKTCPDIQFMCTNFKCIPEKYICDGDRDCEDGSDEAVDMCSSIKCDDHEFTCDNEKCILPVWKCDREDDCGDNSDEDDCIYASCNVNEFSCSNGRCININWRCDSDNDCGDSSDEVLCNYSCDNSTQFTCDSNQCIQLEFVCNGINDCEDGSDEASSCIPPLSLCHDTEFQCSPGECINLDYICDANEDCADGSDESDCGTIVLLCNVEEEFQCNNGQCIPIEWKCDGDPDCVDRSDEEEKNCPPKLCGNGGWACPNHTLCIPLVNLCDGAEHCPGGYDEGFDCDVDACTHPTVRCSHGCQNAPIGYYCTCPDGFKLDATSSTCVPDMNMCQKKRCSQECTNLKGNYSCSCYNRYSLMDDRWTCKSTDNIAPLLVFSNRHQLRFLNMRTEEYGILVNGMRNTIALDFFQAENSVFWTDVVDDKIYRGYLINETLTDGAGLINRTVVVSSGLATAEGLAVDWIGQNLYWVDSLLDQIEVAKLNGSNRTTVIAGNMESPRAIALDSRKGIMFWTDWDNNLPRIESATMSGMNRSVIITVAELSGGWPNGLTLDYEEDRILWIDARSDSIHSAFYNGSNIITILKGHEYLYHPFAITLFEGYLYWSDWRTNMVYKARKWAGDDLQPVQKTQTQPFDIHVIHPYRQPQAANPCADNGGCSHLCLLNGVESSCLCPHMMKLASDMKTCQNDMAFLVILKPTVIRGVDPNDGDFSVIPSWTLPRILNVSSITFSASKNRFYWVDIKRKTISRAFINGTGLETVIAGVTGGTSIALDWITDNIMWTSNSLNIGQISVAKLDGSYRNVVVNGLEKPCNLILQPVEGLMYWINNGSIPSIEQSTMNGTNRITLPIDNLLNPTSIALSTDGKNLYWADSGHIGVYGLESGNQSVFYTLNDNSSPIALATHEDYLYWADNSSSVSSITYTDKIVKVIKDEYSDVNQLLIYDAKAQTSSSNACSNSSCQQMCIPISETTKTCLCTAGYLLDSDQQSCNGITSFLLYSVDSSIQGLTLSSNSLEQALTPITGTALSVSIDFDYNGDYIYWVDTAVSRIRRIKRDLSGRQDIITDGLGRVEGISYDWIAGNLYWTDQQLDLIEVASANGSYRYVLISDDLEKPRSIVVYPQKGLLFWSDWGRHPKIERSTLAGTARMILVNSSISWPNGITIDYEQEYVYWCEAQLNKIERIKIDGTQRYAFGEAGHQDPFSITILGDMMYWTDRTFNGGSIRRANKTNGNDTTTLQSDIGVQIKDIHAFHQSKQTGTNNCTAENNQCEQLCFYLGDHKFQCACAYGVLKEDGKTCRNYNAFIIYSERNILRTLSMVNNSNVYQNAWEPIKNDNIKNAVSLAVDFNKQMIYYSDIQRGNIEQVKFNATQHKIVVEDVGSAEGLAYDPLFQELYWTSYSNSSINRLKPNSEQEIIVQLSSEDRPRGIVVDSCTQYLYWTNWNENAPSIMKSRTNGFLTQTIITEDIRTPNSITFDHSAQKLYWADARLDKIERCDVDGTNRHVILTSDPVHPFGLVVHENYLYWTDWVRRSVLRVDKYTGANLVVVRKQLPQQPMGIAVAFNDTDKCLLWPCNVNNGGCDGKCSTDEFGLVQCSCPPDKAISDTFRCIDKTISCANGSFACHDGVCVEYEDSCNGIKNCADGSDEDENYCSMRTCRKGYFACLSGGCVMSSVRCNGINNCRDATDELDCFSLCDANEFQCPDSVCIDSSRRCDYRVDCQDASDEIGCPHKDCGSFALTRLAVPLPEGMVLNECTNTTLCYLPTWRCDGENDCGDNSDEAECDPTPKTECEDGFFACSQSGRCIPMSWKCDQDNDCGDNEDEQDSCEYTCLEEQFQCVSGRCIPYSWKCDDDNDCGDHSDEGDICATKTCDSEKFMCEGSNICIPLTWVCDGDVDCENGTDEFPVRACAATICYEGEFACDNKRCIQESWTCDHEDDCGDNSDEHDSCEYVKCTDDEFTCTNLRCVAKTWKCDGTDDCQDNSDEEGCDESPTNEFCCGSGECISISTVCDGRLNCKDGMDELNCNTTECAGGASPCEQVCRDTLQGYECTCYMGYQLKDDDHSCEDVNECNTTFPCSQQCFNNIGSFRCACSPNYVLQEDNRGCKAHSDVMPMIYFSNRYLIRKIDPDGLTYTRVAENLEFSNVVALDFDWQEMKLYWSDVTQQGSMISRMNMDGTNKEEIHTLGVRNPDGLAVDWIGRNLYWCDKGLDVIEVSKLNGQYRKTLIIKGLDEPRAIVVNPMKGEMFWTDWGRGPYIGRADMDGSNMVKIITEKLGWPNGLTIDYTTDYIFWADAREDRIEFATSTGQNRRTIISESTPHIFALTLFEDWIYWSDWENRTILKAHKYTGLNQTLLVTNRHRPMDLHVVHPLRQVSGNVNPCEGGGPCSNLCLLTPGEHFTCACPNNFYLAGDEINCVSNCSASQFTCGNDKCVPYWWRCDEEDDCGDKTDEPDSCPPFFCQPGQFQCNNSIADSPQCINPSFLCDADNDCADGSDELNCYSHTCLPSQWKCVEASKCISLSYRCDGIDHCTSQDGGIAEDEDGCPSPTCSPNHFQCVVTGRCIPNIWVCDRENDCVNGTDELNCNNQGKTCKADEFLCDSGNCVPETWYCDGEIDCTDGSDEKTCETTTCPSSKFQCAGSGRCIPFRWKCDLDNDCSDGSDEENCPTYTCSPEEKKCATVSRCIPNRWWCDEEDDCGDNSDEKNCESPKNATCNGNEFQCDNSHCIPSTWRCDSDLDCVDGSDENDCNIQPNRVCSIAEFTCDNNLCKPKAWLCDGDDDCGDNSDEKDEHCAYTKCSSSEFQCLNKKCIRSGNLCNGIDDCGDGSDEHCNANHCESDQFKCDNMQCIDDSLVCDHIKNCGNGSDEMHCMNATSPCLAQGNRRCDVCIPTVGGYYCECRDGFKLESDRSCSDIDECSDFGYCSQLCTNLEGSYFCECSDGYYKEIKSGKSTCKAVGAREYLLLPESSQVIKYTPDRNSYTSEYSGNVRIGAMDFHYQSSTVFMITLHQKNISKLVLSDGFRKRREASQHVLPITGLNDPQDIAVDWVSGKIYWTDAGNDVIQVSNLDGLHQMTLINTNLDQPLAIVLHPKKGLMFWSDWGSNPKIEVANMDGSERVDLVTKDLEWPTGLALDYTQDRLYWADPKAKVIGSVRLNGTDRRIVVNSTSLMNFTESNTALEPFALDIFEDWIYCLTYKKNEMFRVNKFGLDSVKMLKENIRQISDLVIVQEQKQQDMSDPCEDTQCTDGICLLSGVSKSVCKCFSGLKDSTCIGDPCTNYECLHDGICEVNSEHQPECRCIAGFLGVNCERSKTAPCLNYCKNGGNCTVTGGVADCSCPVQFVGAQCGKDLCKGYCQNEGICSVKQDDPKPVCSCPADYTGTTCSTLSKTSSQQTSLQTGSLEIAIPIIIVILVIIIIGALVCYRRQRLINGFKHSRLGSADNDRNFGNPMYIYKPHNEDRLLESPFEMDIEKTSNFSNPAYGSLYNDRNGGSQLSLDEKKQLIDDIEDDNQPLIVDDFDMSFSG